MRYLIIILLFTFSCTTVDRVDDDSNWLTNIDKKVKTKKNEVKVDTDNLVVETPYYKDVEPEDREIRRVEFLKPNKFGVKYSYATIELDDNERIMNKKYRIEAAIFVSNGGNRFEDYECTYIEIYRDIEPEELNTKKMEALKQLRGEFEKVIEKIIKNSNE